MEEGFKGMNWVLHTHLPQALARNWPCVVAMAGWLHRAAGDSSHYPIYTVLTPRIAEMLLRRKGVGIKFVGRVVYRLQKPSAPTAHMGWHQGRYSLPHQGDSKAFKTTQCCPAFVNGLAPPNE